MFKSLTFHVQVGLKSLRLLSFTHVFFLKYSLDYVKIWQFFFFDVVSKRAPT